MGELKVNDDVRTAIDFKDFKYSKDFFDLYVSYKYYLFVYLLVFFILMFFLWIFIFDVDVSVKGDATIRPQEEVSLIKLFNNGIVEEKSFESGQKVSKGDVLFSLNTTLLLTEIENTEQKILRNKKDLETVDEMQRMIKENLISSENEDAENRVTIFNLQKKMKELAYKQKYSLYNNEVSLPQWGTYKQKVDDLKNDLDFAKSELDLFIADFNYSLATEKIALQNEHEVLIQSLFQLKESLSHSVIIAPKDGIIEELHTFSVGDFLSAGEEVVRIIPLEKDSLRAQIVVRENDIANIKEGQSVKIKLSALNFHEYGQVEGIVTRVGADSLYDYMQNPYYQVEIVIDKNYLENSEGKVSFLRPGMTGNARIKISRKKIFKFLKEKIK